MGGGFGGEKFLEMIGIDAREFTAGLDFDVRRLGGRDGKFFKSIEKLGFGVGQNLVELERGECRMWRKLRGGTQKIAAVDGQWREMKGIRERGGKLATGQSRVEFVEKLVGGSPYSPGFSRDLLPIGRGSVAEEEAVIFEEGGGAGVGRE